MFPIIRPAAHYRVIDQGRVHCPTRGREVEFDLCAGCAMATEIRPDLPVGYVRCRPESSGLSFVQWLLA
jgi:hypothetical protein